MTLTGVCYICSKPAMYSCAYCGKISCIDHYDKDSRMCSNCYGRYQDKMGNERKRDPNEILF